MSTKTELRNSVSADVEAFLAQGGRVTKVAAVKVKPKMTVRGSQDRYFSASAPKKSVSNMFSGLGDLNAKPYGK